MNIIYLDSNNNYLIIEVSYGSGTNDIKGAPGYWDKDLQWIKEEIMPEEWIIETFLQNLK